ncbi:MAG: hypothetical protein J1E43_04015 [Christensenellaceae bacterium]|nr:hypothetical protein [Christensenellaceae bacterium]
MKRLLCLTLALLTLAAPASAESLKTTLSVPDHVDLTFTTSTGVTTITINADVEMPDVTSVSTYDYAHVRIPEEQTLAMARALGLEEIKDVWYEWYTEKNFGTIYTDYTGEFFNAWDMYHVDTRKWVFGTTNYVWHGKPFGGFISYRLEGVKIEYGTNFALRPYGTLPENCAYTREEARQMALDLAARVAPEYGLTREGVITGLQYIFGDTEEEMAANWDDDLFIPTGYKFIFGREVDGVPLTVAEPLTNPYDRSVDKDYVDGEYMPRMLAEGLTLTIGDEGIREVELLNPFAVGEVIEESAELLPFESILNVARSILPLKMVTFEGYNEHQEDYRVVIDRVAFGYMPVLKPNAPREYMLVPVWDFFGNRLTCRAISGSYDKRTKTWQYETCMTTAIDQSFLTIDARTGLVIDREYGY